MKKNGSTVLLILVFIAGLAIFAYPMVSDRWNSYHASRAIMSYTETVAEMSTDEYEQFFSAAERYNRNLLKRANPLLPSDEELAEYEMLLNVADNGIMGYVEIPIINISLPIYHGTSESVLQVASGHLDWSSLPVGGPSTHAVLSGHRGLPSADLFTKLDRLVVGDTFMLNVLDETLTYEVDQIHIVLPEDVSDLQVVPGKDYCTLITCTPYGINTHRLLVRGRRIETETEYVVRVSADAIKVEPILVAPVVAVPFLLVMFIVMFVGDRKPIDEKLESEESG